MGSVPGSVTLCLSGMCNECDCLQNKHNKHRCALALMSLLHHGFTSGHVLDPVRWRITACNPFIYLFLTTSVLQYFCRLLGRYGSGGRAVVWQSEGCRFDPTLGVSKCPWARHLTLNCSWRAGWYLAWQPIAIGVWMCVWTGEWEA